MSWDVIYDKEKPCPCGVGTYREVYEMDDWNRTRENVTMSCLDCREKYVKKWFYKPDGEEYWRWVLKEVK
ncbi:hypothetical protein [Cohnella terricola]|uniref:Uncharacterized protein n=1 Tax=Cohnella terricola TaxID=1289167 RepID=A0A559JXD6_9BACL|nr:hypothetical protein [Cohnella terricola]TVY04470.1 hypothetical protein FPZ45_02500 [Cohnella terricola]